MVSNKPPLFSLIIKFFDVKFLLLSVIFLISSSCATYYQKNIKFNNFYVNGNFKSAEGILDKNKKAANRNAKLIYYMNRGMVEAMQSKYIESNNSFEEAYKLADNYHTNYLNESAALLLNSDVVEYKGEDFEVLYINYYKALNYLKLGQKQDALVECRRLNNRLNVINDKHQGKNTFQRDAYIHLIMGLVYESNEEYNNAFIAYRNAVEIYDQDYTKHFNVSAPLQLKKDLLRTAYLSGMGDQVTFYEKQFNLNFDKSQLKQGPEIVFLWQSGMCPVKDEWSINFTIIPGNNGFVTFTNAELGISIPFAMSQEEYRQNRLSDLQFIRVAFPKFVERVPIFTQANISLNGNEYSLQMAEDINAIAFKSLKDRMLLQMGKTLLRVALKKAGEYALRKENENAGMVLGLFNALTEKADTRQWSILPHSIYYSRIPLQEGNQKILFSYKNNLTNTQQKFDIEVIGKKNEMTFHTFSTLDVANPNRTSGY